MRPGYWALLTVGLQVACAGTDTGNPANVEDFSGSECKDEEQVFHPTVTKETLPTEAASAATTLARAHAEELAGLRCVYWEMRPDGQLAVDFTNMRGACGAVYDADLAAGADGAREVRLLSDGQAACGNCIYDWSFVLPPTDAGNPLRLVHGLRGAEEYQQVAFDGTLSGPSGISCDQVALTGGLAAYVGCGRRFGPCAVNGEAPPGCSGDAAAAGCGVGDACVADTDGAGFCQPACTSDSDCGDSGALVCDRTSTTCRPRAGAW